MVRRLAITAILASIAGAGNVLVHSTGLTKVDVIVESDKGGAVTDLTKDDFEVRADGQPRPIESFSSGSHAKPLALVGTCRHYRQPVQLSVLCRATGAGNVDKREDEWFHVVLAYRRRAWRVSYTRGASRRSRPSGLNWQADDSEWTYPGQYERDYDRLAGAI